MNARAVFFVFLFVPTVVVLPALTSNVPVQTAPNRATLTIDSIVGSPSLFGTSPSRPTWSPDSRHLAFLWNDTGRPQREIWITDGFAATPRRLTRVTDREPAPGISDIAWMPDGASLVYLHDGDVWRIGMSGMTPERLTADGGGKSTLAVSPNGNYVSFLREGDLWLYHVTAGELVRATTGRDAADRGCAARQVLHAGCRDRSVRLGRRAAVPMVA